MFKLLISLMIITLSLNSYANKVATSGENISSDKMNSSILQIGSIQQALLTEAEFQQLNGDCWVAMSGQSITGSDYANFTGRSLLPDAMGKFLRNSGGNAAALAETQLDLFRSHTRSRCTLSRINNVPRFWWWWKSK